MLIKQLQPSQDAVDKELIENGWIITKLGIQGPTDTKFQINGGGPILIGQYGIYELDLSNGLGVITSLKLENNGGRVYIDLVGEEALQ